MPIPFDGNNPLHILSNPRVSFNELDDGLLF
jgi:hypothetical protein